jgi:thiol:disulfide interchange protein DsbD
MPRILLPLLLLLALLGAAARADGPVSVRAVPSATPFPQDASPAIVIELKVAPPWHVQSAHPHDPNLIATELSLDPSPGISAGAPKFPVAAEIPAPAGAPGPRTIAVYENTTYLQLPLAIAPDAALGPRTLILNITTQACNDKLCLPPETTSLKIPITIAAAGSATTAPDPDLLKAANAQPYARDAPAAPTAVAAPAAAPAALSSQAVDEQLALIAARPYAPANDQNKTPSVLTLIVLGFLGGAILNIMPCVLPVIPLKVLSLVQQAHGHRRTAILHALSFSAGVITLFIALALFLKAFGLFYGQQFQSPAFLLTMALLVVALALSMLGVWTINPPQALYSLDAAVTAAPAFPVGDHLPPDSSTAHAQASHLSSFTNGLLATLLATPCSAPYLGPLLAWALIQPAWITALSLAWVGVGMSAPYLVLAAFPKLLAKVPRAGRWSELLKQGLGIVMIAVAIYLITLLPNTNLWPWALLAAVLVGLVCWAWGQIPSFNMSRARIWSIRSVALALGLVAGYTLYSLAARATSQNSTNAWQPFSIAALDEGLAENRPVVVDWTANWCINCHALEALVLSSEPVQHQFAASNALLLKADLSTSNPPASALYAKLGGQAIPGLAIFSPGHPTTPTLFRDSYTTAQLLEALKSP